MEWWSLTFPLTAAGLILVLVWERRVGAALTALIAGNLLVLLHEYYSSVYYGVDIFGDKLGYFLRERIRPNDAALGSTRDIRRRFGNPGAPQRRNTSSRGLAAPVHITAGLKMLTRLPSRASNAPRH